MAIKTFAVGEVLTATDTNTYLANSGLVYVKEVALNALSNNIDGVFSNDFDNYKVVVAVNSVTANSVLALRLRAGGDNNLSALYYFAQGQLRASGVWTAIAASSDTSWTMAYTNTTIPTLAVIEIEGPYRSQPTMATVTTSGDANDHTSWATSQGGLMHLETYQADGLNIFTSSGVLNGFVTVFGYRKA